MKNLSVAHNFLDQKWRSSDIRINENVDFSGLLLSEKVQVGLKSAGFIRPSPIQLQAIPLGRCGLDMIVQAKSGTGKTCVFTVVALENLLEMSPATQVLILAPTREIAVQIQQVVLAIGSSIVGLQCHAFIGGLPVSQDKAKLKQCQVAVGTPGRIKQLIEEGALKTNSIRMFVLDEADKLLDDSFKQSINWIFGHLPENKQMIAASATYPEELARLLTRYMRVPVFVRLDVQCQELLGITQYFQEVEFHPLPQVTFQNKTVALLTLLKSLSFSQCLIFTNYQGRAESLCDTLTREGWPAFHISGGQEQGRRLHAVNMLKEFKCRILVSTDVTSRGIDAENVNLVVNFDVPWNAETYLHRVGRAGRFGTRGITLTLTAKGKELEDLQKIQSQCHLHISPLPDLSSIDLWENQPRYEEQDTKEVNLLSKNTEEGIYSDYAALFREPKQPSECLTYAKLAEELVEPFDESHLENLSLDDDPTTYDETQLDMLTKHLFNNHKNFWNKICPSNEKVVTQQTEPIAGQRSSEEGSQDHDRGGGDSASYRTFSEGKRTENNPTEIVDRGDCIHLKQSLEEDTDLRIFGKKIASEEKGDINFSFEKEQQHYPEERIPVQDTGLSGDNDRNLSNGDCSKGISSEMFGKATQLMAGDGESLQVLKNQISSQEMGGISVREQRISFDDRQERLSKDCTHSGKLANREQQTLSKETGRILLTEQRIAQHSESGQWKKESKIDRRYRNSLIKGKESILTGQEERTSKKEEEIKALELSTSLMKGKGPVQDDRISLPEAEIPHLHERLLNGNQVSFRTKEHHENNPVNSKAVGSSSDISSTSNSTTGDSDDSDESSTSSEKLNFSTGRGEHPYYPGRRDSGNGKCCCSCHCHSESRGRSRLTYNYDWARNLPSGALQKAYLQYCGYMEDMLHRKRPFY